MAKSRAHHLSDLFDALDAFERPEGDNDGHAWNGPSIYPYLPPEGQRIVDEIEERARDLVIRQGDWGEEADRRGLNQARKNGLDADFGVSQYNPDANSGRVGRGDRWLDLSDPNADDQDDDLAPV